jgi:hypothetical protein
LVAQLRCLVVRQLVFTALSKARINQTPIS